MGSKKKRGIARRVAFACNEFPVCLDPDPTRIEQWHHDSHKYMGFIALLKRRDIYARC